MHCSRCGLCCEKTEMLLSTADIKRLEETGCDKQQFARYDKNGYAKLKNRHGFCFFYDLQGRSCKAYRQRPAGCRTYPVIYSELEGILIDDLCPMKDTILPPELARKGKKVIKLLRKIDWETKQRTARGS